MKMTEAFSRHADATLWVGSMGEKKRKVLESYGVTGDLSIKELPKLFGILWPQSFFRALTFRRIVREAPPETIFYTRDLLLAFLLSFLSPRFRDNFFFECHSLGKMPSMIYSRVFRSARGIVSTNKAKVEAIANTYGISANRFLVAPNGFDPLLVPEKTRAEVRAELNLPEDKKIILYAGSLQAWKGTALLAELSGRINKTLPGTVLVEFGAEREERDDFFWRFSTISVLQINKYMFAADVLIAPYEKNSERAQKYFSPIKIMEYLASGTPTVATDLPSIREVAGDEELFFVQDYRVEEFERVIKKVLTNPEESARRAQKGRDRVQRYSWDKRAEGIVLFLRGLMGAE
ncbi:MAG: glycosyltransferase family 4 protein [Patescibacteria group bacterium]